MLVSIITALALGLDAVFGEPLRWHPLVGFGGFAKAIEQKLNKYQTVMGFRLRVLGLFAWASTVLPPVVVIFYLQGLTYWTLNGLNLVSLAIALLCLVLAIGGKSLIQHADAVAAALDENNIELARQRIAMMVSRDTSSSDEAAITRATIESVLENGNDAVFAALFWFVLLGAPGVVLYRLSNTLDAMWGYRNERYGYFGWAAARIDDVLNWIPARLTALSYALVGNMTLALYCWKTQAKDWHGINPGVVMASGAGALGVKLGGPAVYHHQMINRPQLGSGNDVSRNDIGRANQLIKRSIVLWLLCIMLINFFYPGL